MKLQIETGGYNQRRYGKPWIAKVDFDNPKGTFTWGEWVGQVGDGGLLLLEVEPGDVVCRGQKDHRGHHGTPEYQIVQPDGTLGATITKAEAYQHWQKRCVVSAGAATDPRLEYGKCSLCGESFQYGHTRIVVAPEKCGTSQGYPEVFEASGEEVKFYHEKCSDAEVVKAQAARIRDLVSKCITLERQVAAMAKIDRVYGVLNAVRVALKNPGGATMNDLVDLLPRMDEVLKEVEAFYAEGQG